MSDQAENKDDVVLIPEVTNQPKKRGRPPGSRNKPKVPNFIPEFLQNVKIPEVPEPIIKDGFPNLPEGKLVGRPMGKKNSGPRKARVLAQSDLPVVLNILGGEDLITSDI